MDQTQRLYGLTFIFLTSKGKKQDKRQLIKALAKYVAANRDGASPAVVLEGNELPEGFDHILITADGRRMVVR
jgi:hypothetical protein